MRIPLLRLVLVKESTWRIALEEVRKAGEIEGSVHGREAGIQHERDLTNSVIAKLLRENAMLQEALKVKPRRG
jgi:predicted transposase YdaD